MFREMQLKREALDEASVKEILAMIEFTIEHISGKQARELIK